MNEKIFAKQKEKRKEKSVPIENRRRHHEFSYKASALPFNQLHISHFMFILLFLLRSSVERARERKKEKEERKRGGRLLLESTPQEHGKE